MRGSTLVRGLVAACAALSLTTGTALLTGTAAAAVPKSWELKLAIRYFPSTGDHSQYDTALVEGRTAWFFGGTNFSGRGAPEVETRAKGRWHPSLLPSGLRTWITGASAVSASDIWAVTFLGGAVLQWNGGHWEKVVPGRWNDNAQFTGITAVSAGNIWLFGDKGRSTPGAGTWHLSGSKWTEIRGAAGELYRASEASPTDLWGIGGTAGDMTMLMRYRGTTWRPVTPAALSGFRYSYVLAVGKHSVWVAGSVAGIPMLGHYDGKGWTADSTPATVPPSGICRDGRGGIWVIANSGFGPSVVYDRSASGTWTTAPVFRSSADEVLSCAAIPGTTSAWGAGKSAAPAGTAAAVYGYGKVP
jgi:hypothetical protein